MDDAPVSTAETKMSNENGLDQQSKEDDEECQVIEKKIFHSNTQL